MSTSNTTPNNNINNYDDDLVEIKWSGNVIALPRHKVDNWFHNKSFEAKCEYVEKHPEIIIRGPLIKK